MPGGGLHRIRIAARKLRYTIEILQPLLGSGMNADLPSLKRIQETLGIVHDLDTLRAALSSYAGRLRKKGGTVAFIPELDAFLEERREEAYKRFIVCWEALRKRRQWKSSVPRP